MLLWFSLAVVLCQSSSISVKTSGDSVFWYPSSISSPSSTSRWVCSGSSCSIRGTINVNGRCSSSYGVGMKVSVVPTNFVGSYWNQYVRVFLKGVQIGHCSGYGQFTSPVSWSLAKECAKKRLLHFLPSSSTFTSLSLSITSYGVSSGQVDGQSSNTHVGVQIEFLCLDWSNYAQYSSLSAPTPYPTPYPVYTPYPTYSSSSSSNGGAVAGSIIGNILCCCCIFFVIRWLCCERQTTNNQRVLAAPLVVQQQAQPRPQQQTTVVVNQNITHNQAQPYYPPPQQQPVYGQPPPQYPGYAPGYPPAAAPGYAPAPAQAQGGYGGPPTYAMAGAAPPSGVNQGPLLQSNETPAYNPNAVPPPQYQPQYPPGPGPINNDPPPDYMVQSRQEGEGPVTGR